MKKVEKVNRNLRKRKISHVLHSDTYRIEKQYAQYNTNISTFFTHPPDETRPNYILK